MSRVGDGNEPGSKKSRSSVPPVRVSTKHAKDEGTCGEDEIDVPKVENTRENKKKVTRKMRKKCKTIGKRQKSIKQDRKK